ELGNRTLADVLLEPHANYVAPIRRALDARIPIRGMAHITGGGLVENVPRILPAGLGATIAIGSWTPQPIFTMMQRIGNIDALEMHRAFNMGIGLAMIAPAGQLAALTDAMQPFTVAEIGRVEAGIEGVRLV
ncbi:MAG: AIR synthase-related protein, partial [Bryocella sp.]